MPLNKFQSFILDRLSPSRSEKVLTYATNLVAECKAYLRKIHLEAKKRKIMDALPADAAYLGTILDTMINQPPNPKDSDFGLDHFEITGELLRHYYALSHIISVQPLTSPVGMVYYLHYKNLHETGKKMELVVASQTCEVGSAHYRLSYNMESIADAHILESHEEIVQRMAKDFGEEIITSAVKDLLHSASQVKLTDEDWTDRHSWFTNVYISINIASAKIATDTRRGRGNYIVINRDMFNKLVEEDNHESGKFIVQEENTTINSTSLQYVGVLGGQYKIYINDNVKDHNVLVGYNGQKVDTGLVYAPYKPVVGSGMIVDPNSFTPTIKFLNRHSKVGVFTIKSYYRLLDFSDFHAR